MVERAIELFGSLSMASRSNRSARALSCSTRAVRPRKKFPIKFTSNIRAMPILASIDRGSISSARSKASRASCAVAADLGRCSHAQPRITRSRASGSTAFSCSMRRPTSLTSSRFSVRARRPVISLCASARLRRSVSNRSAHTCAPVSASTSCALTRTWLPDRRTLPSIHTARLVRGRSASHRPACLVGEGGVARDHEASRNPREIRGQIFCDPISEIFLLRIVESSRTAGRRSTDAAPILARSSEPRIGFVNPRRPSIGHRPELRASLLPHNSDKADALAGQGPD